MHRRVASRDCRAWTALRKGASKLPSAKGRKTKTIGLEVHGIAAPVEVRRHAGARRLTLRVSKTRRAVVVTVPVQCRMDEAGRFLKSHIEWVRDRLGRVPEPVPFVDGALIPVRGTLHRVRFAGQRAGASRGEHRQCRLRGAAPQCIGTRRACRAPTEGLARPAGARGPGRERRPAREQAGRAGAAHRPARPDQPLGLMLLQRPAVVLLAAHPGAAAECSTTSPRTRWRISSR